MAVQLPPVTRHPLSPLPSVGLVKDNVYGQDSMKLSSVGDVVLCVLVGLFRRWWTQFYALSLFMYTYRGPMPSHYQANLMVSEHLWQLCRGIVAGILSSCPRAVSF